MRLRIWGARGSLPVSGPQFSRFGGDTPCIEVRAGAELLVLDAGSGIAGLGAMLAGERIGHLNLFLSHLHHDHLMGLPFLLLALRGEAAITIHATPAGAARVKTQLRRLFGEPYFPIAYDRLFANVRFRSHAIGRPFSLGDVSIRSAALDHPGGSTAWRIDHAGRSIVYATDVEHADAPPPDLIDLCRQADLIITDTMFAEADLPRTRGWGHSTIEAGARLARAAKARMLGGFHHSPEKDDAAMDRHEAAMQVLFSPSRMLRGGEEIDLSGVPKA